MIICVFTAFTGLPDVAALNTVTMPRKAKYCSRHGYHLETAPLPGTGGNAQEMYGFKRLALVIDLLKRVDYDWVWVTGCDILITNPEIKLETLIDDDFGMVAGTDATGCGMDSYLIRKSHGGLELIERLLTFKDRPVGLLHDQSTLDHLWQEPEVKKVVKLIPQRLMNSYKYGSLHQYRFLSEGFFTGTDFLGNSGEWQPGDFVLHTPGLPNVQQKLDLFAQVIPLIKE